MDAESARMQLGAVKQQLAKTAVEAGTAKETAEEMRARVSKLNQNFMVTGAHLLLLLMMIGRVSCMHTLV